MRQWDTYFHVSHPNYNNRTFYIGTGAGGINSDSWFPSVGSRVTSDYPAFYILGQQHGPTNNTHPIIVLDARKPGGVIPITQPLVAIGNEWGNYKVKFLVDGTIESVGGGIFLGNVGIGTTATEHKLNVAGTIRATEGMYADYMAIDHPNVTDNWNTIWQNGFFDSIYGNNSPDEGDWFWGLNIGHRSNHPNYRYGGQLVIKNASDNPALFFRSRNGQGEGVWAKVLHNIGEQQINGGLVVNGTIRTKEVKVEIISASQMNVDGDVYANAIKVAANGQTADFVFEDNYNLRSLAEVENFINENKHLPDIPSASQMEAEGVNLAEMNKLLLMKVEELTLYLIQQQKLIDKLLENK